MELQGHIQYVRKQNKHKWTQPDCSLHLLKSTFSSKSFRLFSIAVNILLLRLWVVVKTKEEYVWKTIQPKLTRMMSEVYGECCSPLYLVEGRHGMIQLVSAVFKQAWSCWSSFGQPSRHFSWDPSKGAGKWKRNFIKIMNEYHTMQSNNSFNYVFNVFTVGMKNRDGSINGM